MDAISIELFKTGNNNNKLSRSWAVVVKSVVLALVGLDAERSYKFKASLGTTVRQK